MFNGQQLVGCGLINGEDGASRVLETGAVTPEHSGIVECHVCCQQFVDSVSLANHDCIPTLQVRNGMPGSRDDRHNFVNSKDVTANSSMTGFSNSTVSSAHSKSVSATNPIKCRICHQTFSCAVDLAHHKCSAISRTSCIQKSGLSAKYHNTREHSDVANSNSDGLSGHKNEPLCECDHSYQKFGCVGSLLKHTETRQTYVCDVCHKAFAGLRQLQAHKRLHSGTELSICITCAEVFTTSGELSSHKCSDSGVKRHVCEVCDQSFAYFHELLDHKRLHFGTSLYLCDICTKAFATSSDLDKHKRCHKSYVSDMRDKTRADLQQHKHVRSGTKTFMCHSCTKVFTTSFELTRHKLRDSCFKMNPRDVVNRYFCDWRCIGSYERVNRRR